jgi:hypothetical protein
MSFFAAPEILSRSATTDEVSEVFQFHKATDVQVGYGIYTNSILGVTLQQCNTTFQIPRFACPSTLSVWRRSRTRGSSADRERSRHH